MGKYEDTLAYMFSQLPMYQRVGKSAFKKNLDNIIKLCAYLGNPHLKFKSIHVAGTNGKGSTTHLISYGLQVSGYKVGVYTSPHYKDFRERIKINGEYMSKKDVVKFIDDNKAVIDSIKPSFFEMTVAMAFDYFAKQEVDVAVIEVGLGGRLDSTNIIKPMLSVITNISFDHQAMLGNDLKSIAKEKAGIIKQGVPVVIGESQEEIAHVFNEKAREENAEVTWADLHISLKNNEVYIDDVPTLKFDKIPLKGEFQKRNIITALHALRKQPLKLNWNHIEGQIDQISKLTGYMGRWQKIGNKPDIIVDSAHNVAGLTSVINSLKDLKSYKDVHCILGFVNDKEVEKLLDLFPRNYLYYFAKANVPRGLNAKSLLSIAKNKNLEGKAYTSVRKALAAARTKAHSDDLIFVGGSIFVVAEVL